MKKHYLFIVLLLFTQSCATISTNQVKNSESNQIGFYYALPKTSLKIDLEFTVIESTKSCNSEAFFCEAVRRGIISSIPKNGKSVTFKVKKISTVSKLDSEELYSISASNKFLNKSEFELAYDDHSNLTKSAISTESQALPLLTTIVKSVGAFSGIVSLSDNDINLTNDCLVCDCKLEVGGKDEKKLNLIEETFEKFNKSIKEVLESSHGNVEIPKYSVSQFNAQKNKLISLHFGSVKKTVIPYSMSVEIPEKKMKKDTNLLTTSIELFAIGDIKEENKNEPVKSSLTVDSKNKKDPCESIPSKKNKKPRITKKIFYLPSQKEYFKNMTKSALSDFMNETNKFKDDYQKVVLNLEIDNSYALKIKEDSTARAPKASFYYRIPSFGWARIKKSDDLLYVSDKLSLTQRGRVIGASPKLKKINFELNPNTGALKSVSGASRSIDVDAINALQDQYISTSAELRKKEPIDQKIEELKKEVELKELQQKLEDLNNPSSESE